LFFAGAIGRAWPELRETFPSLGERVRFCARTIPVVLGAPAIPTRMARRAELAATETFEEDCRHISAPTLVVAGERHLDRIVGVDATMEYVSAIPGARLQILEKTGHLGIVTAPERFAAIVSAFVNGEGQPERRDLP
jgi:pimeloyl-ACP methyl ester carboxylesterase